MTHHEDKFKKQNVGYDRVNISNRSSGFSWFERFSLAGFTEIKWEGNNEDSFSNYHEDIPNIYDWLEKDVISPSEQLKRKTLIMKNQFNRQENHDVEWAETTVHRVCPKCGIPEEVWAGNNGAGYEKNLSTYCCGGCAENTGCYCLEETV